VDPLRVVELERRLGYRFRDPLLLEQALTHGSYANEPPPAADHARHLTARRAELVTGARLARWAVDLDLGPLLRLGRGEDQSGGRTRDSILASALEAVLGAIYREGGLEALRSAIGRLAAW